MSYRKIQVHLKKPDTIYPIVRLPRQLINTIGETANLYETQHESLDALLIVLGNNKTTSKVMQPSCTTDVKNSLLELKSQIAELKSLILQNESKPDAVRKNQRPRARFEPASWPPQGHRITKLPHLGTTSI